jgi:AraC-like DNA-binding protein
VRVHDVPPAPLLQPFISEYKIIETDAARINKILPNTSVTMAFRIRGKNLNVLNGENHRLPEIVVSGLQKSPRLIGYEDNTAALIVLFKAAGAAAFFREPLHRLFTQSVSLDDLITPSETRSIYDQLSEAEKDEERVAIVEQFLIGMIHKPEADPLVTAALQQINHQNGFVKIKDLADQLCISKDAFEKRFRKVVGASPKHFATIVRMSSIIRQTRGRDELLNAAFEAGFFDESHFIKAFRQFTGQSPTDFARSVPAW